jgi:hypothetical protein
MKAEEIEAPAPHLRFPEMIRLSADPHLAQLADAITSDPDQMLWLLAHSQRLSAATRLGSTPRGRG